MMQFLWLYIDELVGKGLSLSVILEFLAWGSATLLPLSLPLATLLASVMTIGSMAENNELIAMKSAGLSLSRIILPLMISSVFISIGAFFAANNLVPVAYEKIYTLRDDIGRTKAEINIPTGTFYDGIEGYILRIEGKNEDTGMMEGVMVYDHTAYKGNISVTVADSASMKMSQSKDYLTFILYNGINYQETNEMKYRDTTLQLQKIRFSRQEMIIPLTNYAFQKSDESRFGNQVNAMKVSQLRTTRDSMQVYNDSIRNERIYEMTSARYLRYLKQLDTARKYTSLTPMELDMNWSSIAEEKTATDIAVASATEMQSTIATYSAESFQDVSYLRKAKVALLQKFAQALACLIMFFLGAPLGAFIRKGGLGAAAIIAVLFFVLYWVIDITGTKLARDGAVSAAAGVFISTVILLPLGLYLTSRAVKDATLFNTDNFKTWSRKIKTKIMSLFKKPRIVYMGTPEFAVAPLDALVGAGYKIAGVVTVPDKPSGRGLKMNESAVKKYAAEKGLPILQPVKLKDPDFLAQLAALKADLFVVVGFRMLPQEVWSMPPLGTINLHAALLPQYRGAAPINWAVINGERISGVTTFMIDKQIDTGGIILRQECRIADTDTAGDLHDALMPLGAELVLQTVQGLIEHSVETRVQRSFIQGSEVLKPAPKLTRELCHIDWRDSTRNICNLIRGLSPYPGAFTELYKEEEAPVQLKIFRAEPMPDAAPAQPGTILSDGKTYLAVATLDGAVRITDLQLSGKKRIETGAFLLGFRDPASYKTTQGTSADEIAKTRNT